VNDVMLIESSPKGRLFDQNSPPQKMMRLERWFSSPGLVNLCQNNSSASCFTDLLDDLFEFVANRLVIGSHITADSQLSAVMAESKQQKPSLWELLTLNGCSSACSRAGIFG
jgi:hypothetical protein